MSKPFYLDEFKKDNLISIEGKQLKISEKGYYITSKKEDGTGGYRHKEVEELTALFQKYLKSKVKKTDMVPPDLLYIKYDAQYFNGIGARPEMGSWMNLVIDGRYHILKDFVEDPSNHTLYKERGGVSTVAFETLRHHILSGNEDHVKQRAIQIRDELLGREFDP